MSSDIIIPVAVMPTSISIERILVDNISVVKFKGCVD